MSLYFDEDTARFTPAYDLVNVSMFPQFKHVLAMVMGDEFAPDSIHAYQLADFAETCNIDKKLLSRLLVGLADKVLNQLSGGLLINNLKHLPGITADDIAYFQTLRDNIVARTAYLKAQAADITSIRV